VPTPPPLTKATSHELAGAGYYLTWREQMLKEVEKGKKPPPELLTLLEASLYKLNDDDLREEYRWYAERYMSDDSSELLRKACEMIVIHIGEVVNMPQGARVDKRKNNKRLNAAAVTPRAETEAPEVASIVPGGAEYMAYVALREMMLVLRSSGEKPAARQFAELDARLMLLHNDDMEKEYKFLAALYLDHDIAVGVRGFCELRLTRLGEAIGLYTSHRLTLVRSERRLAALAESAGFDELFAVAAGAKAPTMSKADLEVKIASMAAAVAVAASVGPGGALLDANGTAILGADGKPTFATDERVPAGGTIGAGGVILDPAGQPVLGTDSKPLVVEIAAAHAVVAQTSAKAAGPAPATPVGDGAMMPGAITPPPTSFTPGSVAQYAKSKDPGAGGIVKKTTGKISKAFSRTPAPASPIPSHDPRKFEYDASAGPSVVMAEGLGVGGKLYETTEDGQLIIPGNWFEKMKQREFLGGMMRSPEQLKQLKLHDALTSQVATHGSKVNRSRGDHTVIETTGTDSRPAVTYQQPKEYEAMQEQMVGELTAFLSGPGNVRAKLKSTKVQRAVPWQEEISANPQSMLKAAGGGGSPATPAYLNA